MSVLDTNESRAAFTAQGRTARARLQGRVVSGRRAMPYRVAWRYAGSQWKLAAYVYRNHRDRMRELRASEGAEVRAWDIQTLPGAGSDE